MARVPGKKRSSLLKCLSAQKREEVGGSIPPVTAIRPTLVALIYSGVNQSPIAAVERDKAMVDSTKKTCTRTNTMDGRAVPGV